MSSGSSDAEQRATAREQPPAAAEAEAERAETAGKAAGVDVAAGTGEEVSVEEGKEVAVGVEARPPGLSDSSGSLGARGGGIAAPQSGSSGERGSDPLSHSSPRRRMCLGALATAAAARGWRLLPQMPPTAAAASSEGGVLLLPYSISPPAILDMPVGPLPPPYGPMPQPPQPMYPQPSSMFNILSPNDGRHPPQRRLPRFSRHSSRPRVTGNAPCHCGPQRQQETGAAATSCDDLRRRRAVSLDAARNRPFAPAVPTSFATPTPRPYPADYPIPLTHPNPTTYSSPANYSSRPTYPNAITYPNPVTYSSPTTYPSPANYSNPHTYPTPSRASNPVAAGSETSAALTSFEVFTGKRSRTELRAPYRGGSVFAAAQWRRKRKTGIQWKPSNTYDRKVPSTQVYQRRIQMLYENNEDDKESNPPRGRRRAPRAGMRAAVGVGRRPRGRSSSSSTSKNPPPTPTPAPTGPSKQTTPPPTTLTLPGETSQMPPWLPGPSTPALLELPCSFTPGANKPLSVDQMSFMDSDEEQEEPPRYEGRYSMERAVRFGAKQLAKLAATRPKLAKASARKASAGKASAGKASAGKASAGKALVGNPPGEVRHLLWWPTTPEAQPMSRGSSLVGAVGAPGAARKAAAEARLAARAMAARAMAAQRRRFRRDSDGSSVSDRDRPLHPECAVSAAIARRVPRLRDPEAVEVSAYTGLPSDGVAAPTTPPYNPPTTFLQGLQGTFGLPGLSPDSSVILPRGTITEIHEVHEEQMGSDVRISNVSNLSVHRTTTWEYEVESRSSLFKKSAEEQKSAESEKSNLDMGLSKEDEDKIQSVTEQQIEFKAVKSEERLLRTISLLRDDSFTTSDPARYSLVPNDEVSYAVFRSEEMSKNKSGDARSTRGTTQQRNTSGRSAQHSSKSTSRRSPERDSGRQSRRTKKGKGSGKSSRFIDWRPDDSYSDRYSVDDEIEDTPFSSMFPEERGFRHSSKSSDRKTQQSKKSGKGSRLSPKKSGSKGSRLSPKKSGSKSSQLSPKHSGSKSSQLSPKRSRSKSGRRSGRGSDRKSRHSKKSGSSSILSPNYSATKCVRPSGRGSDWLSCSTQPSYRPLSGRSASLGSGNKVLRPMGRDTIRIGQSFPSGRTCDQVSSIGVGNDSMRPSEINWERQSRPAQRILISEFPYTGCPSSILRPTGRSGSPNRHIKLISTSSKSTQFSPEGSRRKKSSSRHRKKGVGEKLSAHSTFSILFPDETCCGPTGSVLLGANNENFGPMGGATFSLMMPTDDRKGIKTQDRPTSATISLTRPKERVVSYVMQADSQMSSQQPLPSCGDGRYGGATRGVVDPGRRPFCANVTPCPHRSGPMQQPQMGGSACRLQPGTTCAKQGGEH